MSEGLTIENLRRARKLLQEAEVSWKMFYYDENVPIFFNPDQEMIAFMMGARYVTD